jgi:hemimethylated DNA binding protein
MSQKLARILYRSILQWSQRNSDVPWQLRSADVRGLLPQLATTKAGPVSSSRGSQAVAAIARLSFREAKDLQGPKAREALARGVEALRLLNTTYANLLDEARQARALHEDRSGVEYKVGTVFIHKKYGYRGVIYGWDRRCQRDDAWMKEMQASDVPHYSVLPDETDCIRLFGAVRLTKYVGEDNILPLEGVVPILHRAIDHYFLGQSTSGAYKPGEKLRFEYPNDCLESEALEPLRPAGDDANLLLHAEIGKKSPSTDDIAAGTGQHAASGQESVTDTC